MTGHRLCNPAEDPYLPVQLYTNKTRKDSVCSSRYWNPTGIRWSPLSIRSLSAWCGAWICSYLVYCLVCRCRGITALCRNTSAVRYPIIPALCIAYRRLIWFILRTTTWMDQWTRWKIMKWGHFHPVWLCCLINNSCWKLSSLPFSVLFPFFPRTRSKYISLNILIIIIIIIIIYFIYFIECPI